MAGQRMPFHLGLARTLANKGGEGSGTNALLPVDYNQDKSRYFGRSAVQYVQPSISDVH